MVSAQREENTLQIAFRDNGTGVLQNELALIFDRFYRSDPSRQRVEGGSGLGLAIAKSIVERHNGRIEARSVVGQGLTVIIHLPLPE